MLLMFNQLTFGEVMLTVTPAGNCPEPPAVFQVKEGSSTLLSHFTFKDEPSAATTGPWWLPIKMAGGRSGIASSGGGGTLIEDVGGGVRQWRLDEVDDTCQKEWEQIDQDYTAHVHVHTTVHALSTTIQCRRHFTLRITCIVQHFGDSTCYCM